MSFQEKIAQLQTSYRSLHDLSNQIAGDIFADEQGHLSEEGKKELEQKKKEAEQLENDQTILREAIMQEFPQEYKKNLDTIFANLTTIQKHLNSLKENVPFKDSFNKTLCGSLLPDLTKHIQNKKPKNSYNWLFDVSASLIEEYRSTLKLQ